jgi:putative copper resistance protein D
LLTALVIVRLAHFAANMLLFGTGTFLWALVPADLARALIGPVRRIVAGATVAIVITVVTWMGLEAGQMGDGWPDVMDPAVLTSVWVDTSFGRVWQWRTGLCIALVGVVAIDRYDRWIFIVPASALLLASLGLVGHATMQSGLTGMLHYLNHSVHLLAAGAWLGGLLPFILCLRHFDDPRTRTQARTVLLRFSRWGHLVVLLVVLTGIVNIVLTLGVWPVDLSSPYQTLLIAKIVVVAAMIAIAIFNRYVLMPRLGIGPPGASALKINSIVEVVLGCSALTLVSIFGLLDPS